MPIQVSYVVASYNHEKYVGELLRSILEQNYHDFEIVMIDDGSMDRTVEIARDLAAQDARLQVIQQENSGVVQARNRGIQLARGEYISIVDSDDLLPADRTEFQVEALNQNPSAAMVYGNAWIIDKSGNRTGSFFDNYPPIDGDFSRELFSNYCFVPAVSVMFRRSKLDESGPFWGPGPSTDYLKWIELGLFGEAVCLRDRHLGSWRLHGENVSMRPIESRIRDYQELRVALEELIRRHPELGERIGDDRLRQRYARCHFMGAFYAGLERNWKLAREEFQTAWKLDSSLVNRLAWVSTFPPLTLLSRPLFQAVFKMKLKARV